MRILVTGGEGHVGKHLLEELRFKYPKAALYSLDNASNISEPSRVRGVTYHRDETSRIMNVFGREEMFDLVYHLGEFSRVAESFNNFQDVVEYNLLGTAKVLDYCNRTKVNKIVYAASSSMFAEDGGHSNPYSFTKKVNVDMVKNFFTWYGQGYAICYLYNAFGPGEKKTGNMATLVGIYEDAYINDRPLKVVGSGDQVRRFTYVKDLARGVALVGEKGFGDGYCLYHNNEYSVLDIARKFGNKIEFVEGFPGRKDSEALTDKARQELGWKTTLDIIEYIDIFKKLNPKRECTKE